MPCEKVWETQGLYRKFSGDISLAEILESNLEDQSDYRFPDIDYVIDDMSEITSLSLDGQDTEAIAKINNIFAATKGRFKIAICIQDNPMQTAIAHGFHEQMESTRFECAIFHNLTDARVWAEAS